MQGDRNPFDLRCRRLGDSGRFRGPACTHLGMVNQHVIGGGIHIHDIGNRTDRSGGRQCALNGLCRLRIHQIPAISGNSRAKRLAFHLEATQGIVIAGTQVGSKGLLVRRVLMGGLGQRRACSDHRLSVQLVHPVILFLKFGIHAVGKVFEIAHETGNCRVQCLGRRHIFPAPRIAPSLAMDQSS